MEIILLRKTFSDNSTIGELILDDTVLCFTLEDTDRGLSCDMPPSEIAEKKVYGKTCIPYGRYEVAITFSNRFQKYLPLVMGVPGFDGIRFHSGNTPAHTLGCVLLGDVVGVDYIGKSRIAFSRVFSILKAGSKKEKIFLTIKKVNVFA